MKMLTLALINARKSLTLINKKTLWYFHIYCVSCIVLFNNGEKQKTKLLK